jgi:ribonuclease HII
MDIDSAQMPPDAAVALSTPDLKFERRAARRGCRIVAGVDEAGRGPLAGPVVVSAVILNRWSIPDGLNDSKVLEPQVREALFERIVRTATVAVVVAPPAVIQRLNILQATLWAMRQAVLSLPVAPDHVLIDGNIVPREMPCGAQAIVGGDGLSVSIAAASIVAKVTRDRMCQIMHCEEPEYGFASHKGYSTPEHLSALAALGPGRHHRMDFQPCIEAARVRSGVSISVTVEGTVVAAA